MAVNDLTILVIDDNQDNLTALRAVVSERLPGTRTLEALNGIQGIELALAEDPDVILLDIHIPDMDGCTVCSKIKGNSLTATIPVICLTAIRTDSGDRIKALEMGAEGFLAKPFNEVELIAQIRVMAKIKRANRHERQEKAQLVVLVAERTRELQQELAERRRTEEELGESNERFLSLADNLPGYLAYVNANTLRYEFVSKTFERSFGIPREKIIGSHIRDIIGERNYQFALQYIDATRQGKSVSYENIFDLNTGKRWIQVNYSPVFDASGDVISIVVLSFDITDRKMAEQALLESEARYRRITEGLTDYQYTVRVENGRALETKHSPACFMVTGYSAQEFIDNPYLWINMVAPEDRQMLLERVQQVLAGGDILPIEHKIIRKDGKLCWVRDSIVCHRDASGALISYDGVVKDITQRKRIEASNQMLLKETQDRYHEISALMRASRAVLENRDFEPTARIIFEECKQQLGATAGYVALLSADCSENEILFLDSGGEPCTVPQNMPMPIRGLRAEAYRTGKAVFDNDFKSSAWTDLLPDGHRVLENVLFSPLPVHGIVVGLIGLANKPGGFTDDDVRIATGFGEIAALALANSRNLESLENSEVRFRSLVETATDAIVSIDAKGCITLWNNGAEKIFGYTEAEVMGRNISLIVPPGMQDAHEAGLERARSGRQLHHAGASREMSALKKDGSEIPVELSVSRWQTGEGVLFTGIMRDITERKHHEEDRLRLQAQLNQAQKMEAIGVLAGGIAHDFNNILGAIIGYAEMARDDVPQGSQLFQDLCQVLTSANRAKELVKQILSFSRQSEGERIPIKIQPLVAEALKMMRASIPSTITIEQNFDPQCGAVLANPTQVSQITMNLCSNAFHAMEKTGGVLSVAVTSTFIDHQKQKEIGTILPGKYIDLSVRDSGAGIGPDVLGKIFDPYFTTKEVGQGTGMGLSISHGIIKSYGGAITVESTVGLGTTFHVYFPVIQEEAKEPEAIEEAPKGKGRILFLDDEEVLVKMGKVMLERLGYTVAVYTRSAEALAAFTSDPDQFDLVITDQTMPGITGIELAQRLLKIRPDLPIILCSGYSNLVDEETAKVLGVRAFVLKPLMKNTIGSLIRKVLGETPGPATLKIS